MKCYRPWFSEKLRQRLPCGKCAFCIEKTIKAWCLRLGHEMEVSSAAHFITLTYDDENINPDRELDKRDLCLFIKRLRKRNPGIRYFAVGEYGSQGDRPHYHAVIFNLESMDMVTACWRDSDGCPLGFVSCSLATMGRIRYMVAYMALPQDVTHRQPPFRVMSRRPGIGANYWQTMKLHHITSSQPVVYNFDTPNGMPRYYRDKIFTNRYQKRLMHLNAMEHSANQPGGDRPPTEWEHELLMNKLNRKNK